MTHLTEIELVMALDGEMEPRQAELAMRHIQLCAECRNGFEKLRGVSERVGAYHSALYSHPVAKDAEFTQERVSSFGFRVSRWQWGFAAAVLIATAVAFWNASHSSAQGGSQSGAPMTAKNTGLTDSTPTKQTPTGAGVDSHPTRKGSALDGAPTSGKVAKKTSTAEKPDATLAQFTELPFSDASLPLDEATVVRVELPAAALRQAGVPVGEDNASAMLQADVVLGVDGLPRGIRLVKNTVANHAGTN